MEVLFTIIGIILLVAGSTGIVLTCINYPLATLDWLDRRHFDFWSLCHIGYSYYRYPNTNTTATLTRKDQEKE